MKFVLSFQQEPGEKDFWLKMWRHRNDSYGRDALRFRFDKFVSNVKRDIMPYAEHARKRVKVF